MDLPHPPRAVLNPSSSSEPSSPFPSRPPSPVSPATKTRVSYAYPPTPEIHSPSLGGSVGSTPAQSRSGSLSKNPLLKRAHGQGRVEDRGALRRWIGHALEGKKDRARSDALELEEQLRGRSTARRGSAGQAEAELARRPRWKWTRERAQLAVGFAMIALVGMNDSATGANLDSMQAHYRVSYDEISIVFLANTAGYFLSSISASFFLHHFGLQVSLLTAAAAMATGCVVLSIAPPFPAFIIMLGFMGFGSGMYGARAVPPPFLPAFFLPSLSLASLSLTLLPWHRRRHHDRHRARRRRSPHVAPLLVLRRRRNDLPARDWRIPRSRVCVE